MDTKLIKFETLIDDIQEAIGNINIVNCKDSERFGEYISNCLNPALELIFDYNQVNEYGKIIMEHSRLCLNDYSNTDRWTPVYRNENLTDLRIKIDASKEFVKFCREEDEGEEYKFIFWALLMLTVDKKDYENKLSAICDFASMLEITDEEIESIIIVIKLILHENVELNEYEFDTDVYDAFSNVINWYE